jgi:hypothetical protein
VGLVDLVDLVDLACSGRSDTDLTLFLLSGASGDCSRYARRLNSLGNYPFNFLVPIPTKTTPIAPNTHHMRMGQVLSMPPGNMKRTLISRQHNPNSTHLLVHMFISASEVVNWISPILYKAGEAGPPHPCPALG